jgi:hypothetical protein
MRALLPVLMPKAGKLSRILAVCQIPFRILWDAETRARME